MEYTGKDYLAVIVAAIMILGPLAAGATHSGSSSSRADAGRTVTHASR